MDIDSYTLKELIILDDINKKLDEEKKKLEEERRKEREYKESKRRAELRNKNKKSK